MNKVSKLLQKNTGNTVSTSKSVLKGKPLKNLEKFFMEHINHYFDEIINTVSFGSKNLSFSSNSNESDPVIKKYFHFKSDSRFAILSINNLGPSKEPPIPIITIFFALYA